tara:strand:+ start:705 stop:1061 length:357 start_codon:yes stop_codon:yes gene_type:complete
MAIPLKALQIAGKVAKKAFKAYSKKRMIKRRNSETSIDQMIKMANTKSQSKVLKTVNRAIKRAEKIKDPVIRKVGLDHLKGKKDVRKVFHSNRKNSIYYKGHKIHKNRTFSTGKIGAA